MEPALDEASLVPCLKMPTAERIRRLAYTLKALDALGVPRVLRMVRDAADREIEGGRGLKYWCFDRHTARDIGRFVASRLSKTPYLDGSDGLFTVAEAERAIHSSISGALSLGAGYVALTDSILILLASSTWPPAKPVVVCLDVLTDDNSVRTDEVAIDAVDCEEDVRALAQPIARKVEASVASGVILVERMTELFPRLVLGDTAVEQLAKLTGAEPFFPQVLRHLRALDRAAETWTTGTPFGPEGVSYSVEAVSTLNHGVFGPLRDFSTPDGFTTDRWTLHTKITGGNAVRLYYKNQEFVESSPGCEPVRRMRIAVGYIGPHLPTVNYN